MERLYDVVAAARAPVNANEAFAVLVKHIGDVQRQFDELRV